MPGLMGNRRLKLNVPTTGGPSDNGGLDEKAQGLSSWTPSIYDVYAGLARIRGSPAGLVLAGCCTGAAMLLFEQHHGCRSQSLGQAEGVAMWRLISAFRPRGANEEPKEEGRSEDVLGKRRRDRGSRRPACTDNPGPVDGMTSRRMMVRRPANRPTASLAPRPAPMGALGGHDVGHCPETRAGRRRPDEEQRRGIARPRKSFPDPRRMHARQ